MKILGISFGGKNGNNDSLCKEALMGAQEMGAEVQFVHLLDWNIKPCTGCVACSRALVMGKGNLCSIKNDDLEDLIELILDADGIFIATPIFEKGGTGLLHTLNDRLGPRADKGMNIIGKQKFEENGGKYDDRWLKDKVISFIGVGGSDWMTLVESSCAMLAMTFAWKIIDNKVYSWSKNILMED
jgi:multimeric flavodoxin WrbA